MFILKLTKFVFGVLWTTEQNVVLVEDFLSKKYN